MGTCGMVGPIGILSDMGGGAMTWVGIIVTCIVAPAIIAFISNEILRAIGLIKTGDMQLSL